MHSRIPAARLDQDPLLLCKPRMAAAPAESANAADARAPQRPRQRQRTCRHDARAVRAGGHVQHAPRVARHLRHLDQRGVLPQAQLVLGVAVARQDLALVAVPLQRAHLQAGSAAHKRHAGGRSSPLWQRDSAFTPCARPLAVRGAPRPFLRRLLPSVLGHRPCLAVAAMLTWEPVSMQLSCAPVCVFQKRMQRSAVPPPEASRLDW